jgi:hypothetical protein
MKTVTLKGVQTIHRDSSCECGNEFSGYRVFQKELYNGISNLTVWRVLRKHLHIKAYKLSIGIALVNVVMNFLCIKCWKYIEWLHNW